MAKLVWDQVGERRYETGVDKVVLFPITDGATGNGVAWSGITAINESPSGAEPTKIYADNTVYGILMSKEEDALTVEAFTYPDEFAPCIGEAQFGGAGVTVKQQTHKHFGLCYRTKIGDDEDGVDAGYKLHLFFDCVAGSSEDSNSTINDSPEQKTFSWSVTTLPVDMGEDFDRASCIVIDSTKIASAKLTTIEASLYGGENTQASLPTPASILATLKAQ